MIEAMLSDPFDMGATKSTRTYRTIASVERRPSDLCGF